MTGGAHGTLEPAGLPDHNTISVLFLHHLGTALVDPL
jgi:hypothetical protein